MKVYFFLFRIHVSFILQANFKNYFKFRKNHARAMDSMQASLEGEQRSKAEALRIKKKLEGEINELEIALDHANKANNEAQKSIKRYQVKTLTSHFFDFLDKIKTKGLLS